MVAQARGITFYVTSGGLFLRPSADPNLAADAALRDVVEWLGFTINSYFLALPVLKSRIFDARARAKWRKEHAA